MGKGARTKAANAEINKEKKAKAQQTAAVKKRNSLIIRACTTVVALVLVFAIVFSAWNMISLNNGSKMRGVVAAETENLSVDGAMYSYFINYNYLNYLNTYGEYLSVLGLNPAYSLKDQMYSNDQTWFDYFASASQDTVAQYLMLSEAANAAGFELSEDDLAAIARKAKLTDPEDFGRGLNTEDIRRVLELSTLSANFYQAKLNELAPTMEEIEAEYNKNPQSYQHVDYYSYTLVYAKEGDTSGVEKMSADEAKKLADELAATKSNEEFLDWVVNYTKETHEDATEEDLNKIPENLLTENDTFIADNEVSDWLFDADTKVGDTYIQHSTNNGYYVVYSVKTEAHREEGETVNVRHILVNTEEEAQNLLDTYLAGEQTEEAFGLLAFEFSVDSGSVGTYGLYENVFEGQMVEAFNDWCFDDARAVGDTGIVETEHGFHVMLFCGEGMTRWAATVESALVNAAYTVFYEEIMMAYPVTFHEEVFADIPA